MAKASKAAAPDPIHTGVQEWVVTDKAPDKVAGIRVQPGDKLALTDEQSRFEELSGHIRRAAAPAAKVE